MIQLTHWMPNANYYYVAAYTTTSPTVVLGNPNPPYSAGTPTVYVNGASGRYTVSVYIPNSLNSELPITITEGGSTVNFVIPPTYRGPQRVSGNVSTCNRIPSTSAQGVVNSLGVIVGEELSRPGFYQTSGGQISWFVLPPPRLYLVVNTSQLQPVPLFRLALDGDPKLRTGGQTLLPMYSYTGDGIPASDWWAVNSSGEAQYSNTHSAVLDGNTWKILSISGAASGSVVSGLTHAAYGVSGFKPKTPPHGIWDATGLEVPLTSPAKVRAVGDGVVQVVSGGFAGRYSVCGELSGVSVYDREPTYIRHFSGYTYAPGSEYLNTDPYLLLSAPANWHGSNVISGVPSSGGWVAIPPYQTNPHATVIPAGDISRTEHVALPIIPTAQNDLTFYNDSDSAGVLMKVNSLNYDYPTSISLNAVVSQCDAEDSAAVVGRLYTQWDKLSSEFYNPAAYYRDVNRLFWYQQPNFTLLQQDSWSWYYQHISETYRKNVYVSSATTYRSDAALDRGNTTLVMSGYSSHYYSAAADPAISCYGSSNTVSGGVVINGSGGVFPYGGASYTYPNIYYVCIPYNWSSGACGSLTIEGGASSAYTDSATTTMRTINYESEWNIEYLEDASSGSAVDSRVVNYNNTNQWAQVLTFEVTSGGSVVVNNTSGADITLSFSSGVVYTPRLDIIAAMGLDGGFGGPSMMQCFYLESGTPTSCFGSFAVATPSDKEVAYTTSTIYSYWSSPISGVDTSGSLDPVVTTSTATPQAMDAETFTYNSGPLRSSYDRKLNSGIQNGGLLWQWFGPVSGGEIYPLQSTFSPVPRVYFQATLNTSESPITFESTSYPDSGEIHAYSGYPILSEVGVRLECSMYYFVEHDYLDGSTLYAGRYSSSWNYQSGGTMISGGVVYSTYFYTQDPAILSGANVVTSAVAGYNNSNEVYINPAYGRTYFSTLYTEVSGGFIQAYNTAKAAVSGARAANATVSGGRTYASDYEEDPYGTRTTWTSYTSSVSSCDASVTMVLDARLDDRAIVWNMSKNS